MGHDLDQTPARAAALQASYASSTTPELLRAMIAREFPGRLAVVSSFGAESAVILHLVSRIAPATPVIFLDTGKLFGQTAAYRQQLTDWLGLQDVRVIGPDAGDLARRDPAGDLWRRDPDACCVLRKVEPLRAALAGFDAWITGRKSFQGGARTQLPVIEASGGLTKINPLAHWPVQWIDDYYAAHALPRHPLHEFGFASIGCHPCTAPADRGDTRSGRWAGTDKTECGIHTLL